MKEQGLTMQERAEIKLDLTIDQPISYSQLYDLQKVKRHVKIIWQENKELYNFIEKARMYALLTNQEGLWIAWWEANRYKIGFPEINKFLKQLKYKLCAFCQSPFPQGRSDNIYCSSNCKVYAFNKRKKDKITTT